MKEPDKIRLQEIEIELNKIQELFKEYHSWYDEKAKKVWFPPGRYFNYDALVENEQKLLAEKKSIQKRATTN